LDRVCLLKTLVLLAAIGMVAAINSCTREQQAKGTLEVRVKDHREAIDDFAKLEVFIDAIRLKPWGAWIDLKPDLVSFDLTAYKKGNSLTVFKSEVDSGSFEGFHLKLGKIEGTLKKNRCHFP
jgi:hypothetical protein